MNNMSLNQPTSTNESARSLIRNFWQRLIEPHPSVVDIVDRRRAQLGLALEFIISIFLVVALLSRPTSYGFFVLLLSICVFAYLLGKTRNFQGGIYIFTYGFTFMGFSRILQGSANSIETVIFSTVLISILISSILLSRRGFIGLILLSTAATIAMPNLAKIPASESGNSSRTSGILATVGFILVVANIFRDNLDKEKLVEAGLINDELEKAKADLEKSAFDSAREVKDVNQQIQMRAARLKNISQISQEIIANSKLDLIDLLTRVTQSISEKFGYYHIGIFLMDRNQEYAVLRASNSKGGQQMLTRRHQLRAGGTGVVGYAAQSGRIRMALDTGSDAIYFNNPDLPETRSEIAIPLKHGVRIMGVLDIQSKLPSAFNDEDVELLTIIANQIASEIKSRTELESGATFSDRQPLALNRKRNLNAYTYNPDGTISSSPPIMTSITEKSITVGEPQIVQPENTNNIETPIMAVPVKYREQIVGVINITSAEINRRWSDNEIALVQAIADRAALALENAQLFENATRRAEQEQTITQITNQIGSSTDFNLILKNTIQELGRALGTSRSFIQLNVPTDDHDVQDVQNETG